MFPSLIQSFYKGTVVQKNLKYLKEEKISSFLKSCVSKLATSTIIFEVLIVLGLIPFLTYSKKPKL